MSVLISDCCHTGWYAIDGWPCCLKCDRNCALIRRTA